MITEAQAQSCGNYIAIGHASIGVTEPLRFVHTWKWTSNCWLLQSLLPSTQNAFALQVVFTQLFIPHLYVLFNYSNILDPNTSRIEGDGDCITNLPISSSRAAANLTTGDTGMPVKFNNIQRWNNHWLRFKLLWSFKKSDWTSWVTYDIAENIQGLSMKLYPQYYASYQVLVQRLIYLKTIYLENRFRLSRARWPSTT